MSAMILTDSIDTFTYSGGLDLDDFPLLEQSTGRTTGGDLKTIVAGKRYVETLKLRLVSADVQSLFQLLTKPAATFYYTPKVLPGYLQAALFPMPVTVAIVSKDAIARADEKIYFITITITSTNYL